MMEPSIDLRYFWNKGVSYEKYKEIITLQEKQEIHSSNENIKKLAEYTRLNLSRIHRNDKTLVLEESVIKQLASLSHKINILVISEGWCGDASQIVPVINKMVRCTDKLDIRLVFRDENERLINQYLTNGGKAIPIVILINAETFQEIAHWGPRPQPCTPFLQKYKSDPQHYSHDDFAIDIQNFYNQDKGHTISKELTRLIVKS
ncbi:thioredoxin family protein [Apibacter adventoris]|uniref:thioredoxin family protein n=1 Tax=Apibacter adventoris TaxID=1679466 RepID=UPI000CF67F34|nr:thioredoxin family protein [Apibacter adventoris]PQL94437.1 thioredoxin family protein [Apibacter adventoris]